MALTYPNGATERDKWILDRRPQRTPVSVREPYAFFIEDECGPDGKIEPVGAIFLANRECPFRCAMCDLWRNTLTETVPIGAIPEQIDFALKRMGPVRAVKLYNSGSFFDPRAIPPEDYEAIAALVRDYERVIVECHPAFVGERCNAFRALVQGRLEVAMGLETAHPDVLEKLNKRLTLEQFAATADILRSNGIDLRVFILVQPPFMKTEEALYWTERSLDLAFDCGAIAAALIPTRNGNGAMEALEEAGMFVAPKLSILEDAAAYGLQLRRGRVFTDLWELKRGQECEECFDARVERLREMNLLQTLIPAVQCPSCSGRQKEAD